MNLIRARTIKMLEQLPVAEWESSSRCAGWSVHDVARHIRDFALIHTARLAGRPSPFGDDPFDPRSSPAQWLRHSEGTPTTQTLDDLRRLAGEEAESIDRRIDDPPVRLWWSPLRRKVHWSVFSLHIFWDAWLHESDIAVALGRPVDHTELDLQAAIFYALLSAAAPHAWAGRYLETSFALAGSPSESYRISHVGDDITITAGPGQPATLLANTTDLIDSLAGRGSDLQGVLTGPEDVVARLGLLRKVGTVGT